MSICGETRNTLGCCVTTAYLIYATEIAHMLHMGLHCRYHKLIAVCFPTEPELRGQGEVKNIAIVMLKIRLFRHHQNGPMVALKLPLQNDIYPISCPRPAARWLCDLSQGHMISLGS